MIDSVRYPWAMVVPKGPDAARSGSTWIHWWSPVASANRLTCAWSITCQSDHPRCWPDSLLSSSMLETVVVMTRHYAEHRDGRRSEALSRSPELGHLNRVTST